MTNTRKAHPLLKLVNSSLIDLPAPSTISYWWNFGSLLGLCLTIQLISGVLLAIHYCPSVSSAFNRVVHISQDVFFGWLLRNTHANGASLFFICLYLHIRRGIYYYSFKLNEVWNIGVVILLTVIATAFMGYVSTLGANILLGGHSNYQPFISYPLYWRSSCSMNLRGVCHW